MAGDKFLYNNAGTVTEKASIQSSAGAGDAGKIPALDSAGKLATSMMPAGIVADTTVCLAFEDLAAGDWVNLFLSGGVIKARKADATTAGKEADGFVLAVFLTGASATVYHEGTNSGATGRTVGATQFLSTTAGTSQETAPSAAGNVVQRLGKARSATEVPSEIGDPLVLA